VLGIKIEKLELSHFSRQVANKEIGLGVGLSGDLFRHSDGLAVNRSIVQSKKAFFCFFQSTELSVAISVVFLGYFVQHDQRLGDIETLLLDELVKIKIVELLRQVSEMEGRKTVLLGGRLVSLMRARALLLLRQGGTHDSLQTIHDARIHNLVRRTRMRNGLLLLLSDRHRVGLLL
jgi:hypothetical protein